MKNNVIVTLLVIGMSTLLALTVMTPSLAAPAEPVAVIKPLKSQILAEHRSSTELSDRLVAEHEEALAAEAAEAEAALLAEAERSQQLTYEQLQMYVRAYGCTPEQRRSVESGGNYGVYTGNGYVGGYQFSEQYLPGWMAQAGLGEYNRDAFLADPGLQDQLANWYAESRYGGWSNVPSSGGW